MATPIHTITTIAQNSQNEHTSFNSAIYQLDSMAQMSAVSIATNPPVSSPRGDAYLVASSGAYGDFLGKEGNIAYYISDTAPDPITEWRFISPTEGMQIYIKDIACFFIYIKNPDDSFSWTQLYLNTINGHIIRPDGGRSNTFNTELIVALELGALRKFVVTEFHAQIGNATMVPPGGGSSFYERCELVLQVDGVDEATTVLNDDALEDYTIQSIRNLNITVGAGKNLSLKIHDIEDNLENVLFSVFVQEQVQK